MTQFTNPLNNIKIASPCSADWDAMIGNNRKRYCGECKLNVYNLSGMSQVEAENLLIKSEGRVCVRYFRRDDGTIITNDCPVGLQAVKMRLSRFWTATASLFFAVFGGIGLTTYFLQSNEEENLMGQIAVEQKEIEMGAASVNEIKNNEVMGKPAPMMGNIAIPREYTEGKISNFNEVKRKIIKKHGS